MKEEMLVPFEKIDRAILLIRGKKVMLDSDLALIYGVKTFRLNEQVKRNKSRFPEDFMFQLTDEEKQEVIANCDHLEKLKYSPTNPYAFTEHGAIMLASVLNTPVAIHASIQVVRAFIRLREMVATHQELSRKLQGLDEKVDRKFSVVFKVLDELINTPELPERTRMGFMIGGEESE
jgi:hypothetical protein